ncbi:MAG TPA: ShlB/FhaC/HecB family hemolysin secretion/activation protein, partial [Chitinophagaceae bacterium]
RNHLAEYADTYYHFLSPSVDIPGTSGREYFEVNRKDDEHTLVSIYNLKKDGTKEEQPGYRRIFLTGETNEIRLYGMEGDDIFELKGNVNKAILVRLIPGAGIDAVMDQSAVAGRKKMTMIYDDEKSGFTSSSETRTHISKDTVLNNYIYKNFKYDKKGIVLRPGLTIGVGYYIENQKWRKYPFGTEHRLMGYYGPNRGSVALEYRYIANQFIGNWNLEAIARTDIPFVANYYGTGNESVMNTDVNRKYYRFRSTIYTAGININRTYDSLHHFNFNTAFQAINLVNEEDRFIAKDISGTPPASFEQKYFVTAGAGYQFKKSNDPIVPSKGFEFNLTGAYTQNIQNRNKAFATYASSISFYLPFFKNLSLAMRAGGSTVTGKPEFYQLTTLSGKENMRGFRRQRFYGKTNFYNNNELRLILNTSNHLFNGKIGVLAFVDQGRVWQPGEISDTWHVGYGGGFFVAPFNRILLNASYGISKDDRVIHFRVGFFF